MSGDGARDPVRTRFGQKRTDVHLTELVRARHYPHAVGRGTAIELAHEVEPMGAFVPAQANPSG